MTKMCFESPYLQGMGAKQTRGGGDCREVKARKVGGADTPFPSHTSPHILIIPIIFFISQIVQQIAKRVKVVFAMYVSKDILFTKALEDSVKVAAFVNAQKVTKQG